VEVKALGARDYTVNFGPGTAGINQPTLAVQDMQFDPMFAFLPVVQVSTVRQATAVGSAALGGVPTIAVSDSLLSPIVAGADVVFEIPDMPEAVLRTMVAPMCLVQTLAVGLTMASD